MYMYAKLSIDIYKHIDYKHIELGENGCISNLYKVRPIVITAFIRLKHAEYTKRLAENGIL